MRPFLLHAIACGLTAAPALLAIACGGGAPAMPPPSAEPEPPRAPPVLAGPPELAEGTAKVDAGCDAGMTEICNALDEDCDGQLDEGCDWAAEALQVVARWNTKADIDLYVVGPDGAEHGGGTAEGTTRHDGDGACGEGDVDARSRLAAVGIDEEPARGRYTVEVVRADPCGTEGPTTVSVSVAAGGTVAQAFNRTLDTDARTAVLELTVE